MVHWPSMHIELQLYMNCMYTVPGSGRQSTEQSGISALVEENVKLPRLLERAGHLQPHSLHLVECCTHLHLRLGEKESLMKSVAICTEFTEYQDSTIIM